MVFVNEELVHLDWEYQVGDADGGPFALDVSVSDPMCAWVSSQERRIPIDPRCTAVYIPRVLGDMCMSHASSFLYKSGVYR